MNIFRFNDGFDSARLIGSYERLGERCGQFAITLGLVVLFGWAWEIAALTNIARAWVAMQPNTAVCLVLVGTGLIAARTAARSRLSRTVQAGTGGLTLVIAVATLAEYAFGIEVRYATLFHANLPASNPLLAGSMALATAASFMCIAIALLLLDLAAPIVSQLLAMFAALVATLAVLGYAYDVTALYGVGFYSKMAIHTAIGILAVSVGVLLTRPARGVVGLLVSGTVGGFLARRLLPFAVAAPFLLGWLCIQGTRARLFESAFGVAMYTLAHVVLFSLLIWRTGEELRRSDTARLDAEQIGRLSQAKLHGLVESAMDAIIMLDETQSIIVFNRSAEKMFGYTQAQIIGQSLNALLPQRYRARHGGHLRAFRRSGASSRGMGKLGSIAALRADGTEFPVEVSISHFSMSERSFYSAIVRDITERTRGEAALYESERRERERSQELTNLLFAVPAAVCYTHDPTLAECAGNELFHRWFPASEIAARPHGDACCPGEDQSVAIRSCRVCLQQAAAGKEMRNYEFTHVYPDGTTRHFLGNAIPFKDAHGCVCGAISAFVDVTEWKLAEQALRSATATSMAKSDYITHMTHELRTPLGTMLGYAQMLENGVTAAQLPTVMQILKAGWHMRDLITEVQDLANIEASSAHVACAAVRVDELLQEVLGMMTPLLVKAGVRVIPPQPCYGLTLYANQVRIKQVMFNLLSNAIKYNRRGGTIDISCSEQGKQVRIGIRDTGHGLTPQQLACLFQPFNRLGQEYGSEVGSGVGLVVTKKLIELMGGTIGAESEVGRGTLFWFQLPAAKASPDLAARG